MQAACNEAAAAASGNTACLGVNFFFMPQVSMQIDMEFGILFSVEF
jgi:hypothetical protein